MEHAELLHALIDAQASDLHCKPGSEPVLRIGGELVRHGDVKLTANEVASLAQAILDEDTQAALLQSGSVVAAHSEPGVGRFRVSAFRQRGAISLVLHTVADDIHSLESLGLPPVAAQLAEGDRGLVLVASPVGHGVTTTLAALVNHVNTRRSCHILTVDDPIEILHRDDQGFVSQLEVGADVSTIAEGVRAASRVDADVVAVSEITHRDTVDAALDAVARGRLVFAGIGGATVADALHAIFELYSVEERTIISENVARSTAGILAQQLLPGLSGQPVVAVESLTRTPKVQECIAAPERTGDLRHLLADGHYHGMQTMDQALVQLVCDGKISTETALGVALDPEDMRIELVR